MAVNSVHVEDYVMMLDVCTLLDVLYSTTQFHANGRVYFTTHLLLTHTAQHSSTLPPHLASHPFLQLDRGFNF